MLCYITRVFQSTHAHGATHARTHTHKAHTKCLHCTDSNIDSIASYNPAESMYSLPFVALYIRYNIYYGIVKIMVLSMCIPSSFTFCHGLFPVTSVFYTSYITFQTGYPLQ